MKYTLELGGKSSKTFLNYKSHITRFLNNFADDVEINKLSEDQIANYFIRMYIQKGRCASTLNVGIASVRFFYSVCFNRKLNKDVLPSSKITKKMPTIISKQLFLKLVNEEHCLKYQCWLLLAFCCGLRAEEVATLRIENIFPEEHKLKVLGKRKKERYTILPDIVTKYLRKYCKEQRITKKQGFLFSSYDHKSPINSKSIIF